MCTPLLGDALFASNAVAYLESVHSREFAGDGVSSQLADLHVKMVDWQVKVFSSAHQPPPAHVYSRSIQQYRSTIVAPEIFNSIHIPWSRPHPMSLSPSPAPFFLSLGQKHEGICARRR